jgi:hypothetical protein
VKATLKKPKWPSIKEQISADKAARNSALEKLIKENQDFDLLQPEEANDDAGLPPWLRVYWRKSHPEEQHSTVNPGAGYPDVLYEIHEWMLAHQDLKSGKKSSPSKSSRRDVKG